MSKGRGKSYIFLIVGIGKGLLFSGLVAWLFYKSFWGMVLSPVLVVSCMEGEKTKKRDANVFTFASLFMYYTMAPITAPINSATNAGIINDIEIALDFTVEGSSFFFFRSASVIFS